MPPPSCVQGAAIFIYIFCGWFPTSFVINFCLIAFLLVCDFWTVGAGLHTAGAAAGGAESEGSRSSTAGLLTPCCTPGFPAAGQECVGAPAGGAAVVERGVRDRRQRLEV